MTENEKAPENTDEGVTVSGRFLMALFVGFAIIVVGIVLVFLAVALGGGGSGSVGGVIFIGPFPIVFGAGPDAMWLIVVGLVLAVLMFVLFFVLRRRAG